MSWGDMKSDEVHSHPETERVVTGCEAVVRVETLSAQWCAVGNPNQPHPGESAWCRMVAQGAVNAFGRPLRRLEAGQGSAVIPALTGAALSGLRVTGFLSAPSLAACEEDLRQAVVLQAPMVLHVTGADAGEGVDSALQAVADSGAAIWLARDSQEAADLALIARRLSETALIPVLVVQDAFTAFRVWSPARLPGAEGVRAFLGAGEDAVEAPTPAQRMAFGATRARVPTRWSVDDPTWIGTPSAPYPAALAEAGRTLFHHDAVAAQADAAAAAFAQATGRDSGAPLGAYRLEGSRRVVLGHGAVVPTLEAMADAMHSERKRRFGVLNLRRYRPFPGPKLAEALQGREGVAVLERTAPALSEDAPLLREVRAVLHKSLENGAARRGHLPHPGYPATARGGQTVPLISVSCGLGGLEADSADLAGLVDRLGADTGGVTGFALPGLAGGGTPPFKESPRHEILRQELDDTFPGLAGRSLRSTPGPELLSESALSLRITGVQPVLAGAGLPRLWDGSLEGLLAEVGQCHVKGWVATPHASVDRPTLRQVVADTSELRTQSLPQRADAVVVLDPRVFAMSAPLAGLGDEPGPLAGLEQDADLLLLGGAAALRHLNPELRERLVEMNVRVSCLEPEQARAGAALSASEPGVSEWRVMGALLALPAVMGRLGLDALSLGRALKRWTLVAEDRAKEDVALMDDGATADGIGAEDIQSALYEFDAGRQAVRTIDPAQWPAAAAAEDRMRDAAAVPDALKRRAVHGVPAHDAHRFWVGTGAMLTRNLESTLRVDPALSLGSLPSATGDLRNIAPVRLRHPRWLTDKCTGCGECWVFCPDAALPSQVNTAGELLQAGAALVEAERGASPNMPRALRAVEGKLKNLWSGGAGQASFAEGLRQAIAESVSALPGSEEEQAAVHSDLNRMAELLEDLPLARTESFFAGREAARPGSGGWLSIALNPERCKSCGLCLAVCPEQALVWEEQSVDGLTVLRRAGHAQRALPDTAVDFMAEAPATNGGDAGGSDIRTLLLRRHVREAMRGGSDGAAGAPERTLLRLFAATVAGELQPRLDGFLSELDDLVGRMEAHIRNRLAVDAGDPEALRQAMASLGPEEFTLGELSERMDRDRNPVDATWLRRVTDTMAGLKALSGRLREGQRAWLGMAGAGGAADIGRWPYSPFPFPWSRANTPAGAAQALGLFEGHMARMAEDFKLVRLARLELDEAYNDTEHGPYLARFGWRDFDEGEWALVPPVVLTVDEAGMTGEARAMLEQAWRGGMPLRVLYLARHGSGSAGRSTQRPMAPQVDGEHPQPRQDPGALPADPTLAALAEGTVYLAQDSLADVDAMVSAWRQGLAYRGTAWFSVFAAPLPRGAMPLEGEAVGTEATALLQARMAVGSRAHPRWRFDPALGRLPHEALDLSGNPEPDSAWGVQGDSAALTFAEFAVFHPDWEGHWHAVPEEDEGDDLVALPEYLELDEDDRAEARPCAMVAMPNGLRRLALSEALVRAAERKASDWRLLRSLARLDLVPVDEEAIAEGARREVSDTVWKNLVELARSEGGLTAASLAGLSGESGDGEEGGHA